jgi:tripartite-type tricarboxylate transporter receptor subunit TctC
MQIARKMLAWLVLLSSVFSMQAHAAAYPNRPVHMVLAFPPGGTLDTLARIVLEKLSEKWGQAVIVENRPGAGGNIGAVAAAHSAPDGYTLHFGAQSLAVNVTLAPQADFNPADDFVAIVLVATAQDVLMVPPNSPFHSVQDLLAYAKAHPGELNYASLGPGTSAFLATGLLDDLTGIKMQNVSYTSLSQATTDLMAARVAVFFPTLGGHLGRIKGGSARALAVSGAERADQLPDVPTFKELGIPFVAETSWYGIYAPKGTAGEIITKVNKDVNEILAEPGVKEKVAPLGFRLLGGSPSDLQQKLAHETARWAKAAKDGALR